MYFDLGTDRRLEQEDLARFMQLYGYSRPGDGPPPPAVWDERADAWEAEFRQSGERAAQSLERVTATLDYLQAQNILRPDCDVADVGCGPGRFVAGFARICHSAFGLDVSPRMIGYAEQYAQELGLANTRFMARDFHRMDVDREGLTGQFDLVFCSITPAANGVEGLEKLMRMSRGWCFCSNFVSAENHLEKRMAREVFGQKAHSRWDAHWTYALFNMLFLAGYDPKVQYYSRHKEELSAASRENALRYMQCLQQRGEEEEEKVLHWLEEQADEAGNVVEKSDFTYAWILWDVRRRCERQVYPADYR